MGTCGLCVFFGHLANCWRVQVLQTNYTNWWYIPIWKIHGEAFNLYFNWCKWSYIPPCVCNCWEESHDSWSWFFIVLRRHVTQREGICLISDRHAGINIAFRNPSNFEETPSTIPKKWNYTKVVSWRDTFHNFKKIWVYAKQFLYTVENFKFMLKVSLQETSLVLKSFS